MFPIFSSVLKGISSRVPVVGLDLRSIALVRIGFALVFLVNLWDRTRGGLLDLHYSKTSLLSLQAFPTQSFSLLDGLSGLPLRLVFGLFALVGVGMLVGYKARLMSWLSFGALMLLSARTPHFTEGSESTFRLYFLLACMLPLGARYSVDSVLASKTLPRPVGSVWSFPVGLLVAVISSMYFLNAWEKSTHEVWYTSDALRSVVGDVAAGKPLLHWLRHLDSDFIFGAGAAFTLIGELILGFLPVLALRSDFFKWATWAGMFGLHFSIWLLIDVGPFSPFLLSLCLIFLPGSFHETLGRLVSRMNIPPALRFPPPVLGPCPEEPASFRSYIVPGLVALLLLPIMLGANPVLWKLPFPESWIAAVKKFQPAVYRQVRLSATWQQFGNVAPHHSAVFVEAISDDGRSAFYPDGSPLKSATAWEANPGPSPGRFFHYHHRIWLANNAEARRVFADYLFGKGFQTVHYWRYSWDYVKGSGWVSSRSLVSSHGAKRWVGFHTYVLGGAPQHMHSFSTLSLRWDDDTQVVFAGVEGNEIKFPKWAGAPLGIPVSLNLTSGPDFGIYTIFVNGAQLATVDLYSPTVSRLTVPIPSTFVDVDRSITLSFVCDGKSSASSGFLLGANSLSWNHVAPSAFKPGDPP